jgi:hypothetical protein
MNIHERIPCIYIIISEIRRTFLAGQFRPYNYNGIKFFYGQYLALDSVLSHPSLMTRNKIDTKKYMTK